MMRRFSTLFSSLICAAALLFSGCLDAPDLPTSISGNPDNFGANDTSFVRVKPDWDDAHGYDWENPGEIHIARDGYLYVADERDGGRVVRLKLDGSLLQRNLFRRMINSSGRVPIGLGQDSKLNLYMVDGSNQIYVHNTIIESEGVASVVVSFEMVDLRSGDRYMIDDSRPIYEQVLDLYAQGVDSLALDYDTITSTSDPDTISFYSRDYLFLTDSSGAHESGFTDVDGGPAGASTIYVTDQGNDRIARFAVAESRILNLENGDVTFVFHGLHIDDAIQFGSGQVSTNNPTSVVTTGAEASTRLYFTQVDGNFLFQRLRPSGSSWQYDIQPSSDGPPISELGYFDAPVAVAVGESDPYGLGLFYVADSTQNRVTAFYPGGSTFRHVAAEMVLVDLEPGQYIEDALGEQNIEWHPELNYELIGYYSSEPVKISVEAGETLRAALARAGYEFISALNPAISPDVAYPDATTVRVNVPAASTVQVFLPILDKPRGVATRAGVVYITDSGNNRIVRFSRSDSKGYIPNDPNYP